jgi:membrane-associated phospholipid phosphatase
VGFALLALRADSVSTSRSTSRVSARAVAFWVVLALYLALTILVIVDSPVLTLDKAILNLHLQHNIPGYKRQVADYVMFGQRGPASLVALPFFFWMAWRERSSRPLVMLGTALVLLNVTVGIVKYATGRMGPLHQSKVHDIFVGGNIYPSGHVSNAVVLYGLIAMLVPRFRKTVVVLGVWLCVSVGVGTLYLRTHWFSDVVAGWLAGSLVLLSLPTVMPTAQRWTDAAIAWLRARWRTLRETPRSIAPVVIGRPHQRTSTAVSSVACSHSLAATASSREAFDEPTRLG